MSEDIKVTIDTGSIQYGQLEIGQVTTGKAGTEVIVTNSGSDAHAILNFTIPKGDKGDKGDRGEQGPAVDVSPIYEKIENEAEYRKDKDDSLQTQINSLASGSPLVASSIEEMTDTTKTYVNTADGKWYYYNGTTWVEGGVYQSSGIADGSITPKMTNFIEECTGKNKFNKDNAKILNYYMSESGKKIASGNAANKLFYIPIEGGKHYNISLKRTNTFLIGSCSEEPQLNTALNKLLNMETPIYQDELMYSPYLTLSNDNYLVVQILSNNDSLTISDVIDTIQVEEGISYTGYEEPKFNLKNLSIGFERPYTKTALVEGTTKNANYRLWIPANYEESIIPKNKGIPLIIGFHGNGSGNNSWTDATNYPDRNMIRENCINAGYMFLVVERKNQLYTWGNKECVKAYSEVLNHVLDNYSISKIGVFANSMGGIESLNFISEKRVPITCYVGTSLTYNLEQIYNNGKYTDRIKTAYEISEDGSDYEIKTKGKDPSKKSTDLFGSFPCLIIGATDDTAINQNENAFKFYEDMSRFSDCTKIKTTGGHAFDITNSITNIMDFYSLNLD